MEFQWLHNHNITVRDFGTILYGKGATQTVHWASLPIWGHGLLRNPGP